MARSDWGYLAWVRLPDPGTILLYIFPERFLPKTPSKHEAEKRPDPKLICNVLSNGYSSYSAEVQRSFLPSYPLFALTMP